MRRLLFALLLVVLAAPGASATPPPFQASTEDAVQATPDPGAAATVQEAPVSSGLPQRVPPPRTLEAYWHVFAIFAVTWVGVIFYMLRFGGPLGRISRSLDSSDPRL